MSREGFQTLIGGKYRLRILWELKGGPLRYGALKTALAASMANKTIAARVVSRDLNELANRFMVNRKEHIGAPRQVEYSLTDVGKTFLPVLEQIHQLGVTHLVKQSVLDALSKTRRRK